jgi:hypothetical protein
MGDYRSPSLGTRSEFRVGLVCGHANKFLSLPRRASSRAMQSISRQPFDLPFRCCAARSRMHFDYRPVLIPRRYKPQTKNILDTFLLTNHSPLTVGDSSGLSLGFHFDVHSQCAVRGAAIIP